MFTMLYGMLAYLAFLAAILYAIGFVGNLFVPKSIDSGPPGEILPSVAVDALLLSLFAIQHTIMARPGFKKWWTRFVPAPLERSTFVLCASLLLMLLFWQWRPIPGVLWEIEPGIARSLLVGLSLCGWGLVFYASFLIDHFDLFGLRQTFLAWRGRPYTPPSFKTPLLYRMIRNPLMLGFLIAFWSTPSMTHGHALFCVLTTAHIFVGISFEERDLLRILGEDYRRFREQVPMILPWPRRKPGPASTRPQGA
jgi:protein-S-isoprenylcysteine O-methyltransferase Ste14